MTTPVLSLRNLTIAFGAGEPVVRDVSLDVAPGEVVAIVGESGSGKTITALAGPGLLPDTAQVSGTAQFDGQQLIGADPGRLRAIRGNDIAFVFQEPMTSLNPLHTIEKQIGEVLRLHQGLRGAAARERIIDLLTRVGIPDPASRLGAWPHQLSGGQRQRVMIAMALANEPKLLIADEPTTALDVTIQAQILDLLVELRKQTGLSILFITHDLSIVRRIADRVVVMQAGRVVETGTTAQVLDAPKHPYTRALVQAGAAGSPAPVPADAPEMLRTSALRVWFAVRRGLFKRVVGHIKAVNSTDLHIRAGETLGIVGESGSGKTTVALAVLRLISSQGEIVLGGTPIHKLGPKAMRPLRRDIQIVFQDPFGSLSPRMTVEEIVSEGLAVHGLNDQPRQAVAEALHEVGLDPATMDRYPHEFSGGQRQRIAIARAIALKPRLVVLDEPTSALDMTVQAQIVELLRDLQARLGLTYLFISHDLRVVRALSHRVMVMQHGDVVETGLADQIFDAPTHPYTQQLVRAALAPGGG